MSNDRFRLIIMLSALGALALPRQSLQAADCNTNGIDDAIEIADSSCIFPGVLIENPGSITESDALGAPDDVFVGLGADHVTYEISCSGIVDVVGPEITVYEVDFGVSEFGIMDILVSENGIDFVSIKSAEHPAFPVPGDDIHSNPNFARSYDIAISGLPIIHFVRIQGTGSGGAGTTNGFDLDAIGFIDRAGFEFDCNSNAILDECEPDCNINGIPDECDIAIGVSADCNANQVPDFCELSVGTSQDCNNNGIPDDCEPNEDCNSNGILDICDIGASTSQDCNGNLAPDECEISANSIAPGGPFFCNSGCDDDCDNDGVPDACGVGVFVMNQPIDIEFDYSHAAYSESSQNNWPADDFVLPHPSRIGAIEVHGYLVNPSDPSSVIPPRPSFRVIFFDDNPGLVLDPNFGAVRPYDIPGETVATYNSPPFSMAPTGNVTEFQDFELVEYTFKINLPQPVDLSAGAHWLSVVESSEDPLNAFFYWSLGSLDPYRSRPGYVNAHPQLIWGQLAGPVHNLAFALHAVEDCDENGVLDACEIAADPDLDCPGGAGNGVLDSCEGDCDSNGVVDTCEVELGLADDCDHSESSDACDIASGAASDVNSNLIPDSCEIDCDNNSVPDDWQVETGVASDANTNGLLDHCEVPGPANGECVDARPICPNITYHGTTVGDDDGYVWFSWTPKTSVDGLLMTIDTCGSQIPVAIEGGCTNSATSALCTTCETMWSGSYYIPDYTRSDECVMENWEVLGAVPGTTNTFAVRSDGPHAGEFSFRLILQNDASSNNCENAPTLPSQFDDCDDNSVPDDAQPDEDCNENGVRDICEAVLGISTDCDRDGVPDECMLVDCNTNGIHDACEADCNANGSPDDCDIAGGTSMDCNGDGGPDECDPFGRYGSRLSINGTHFPDHWFTGPPDNGGNGIGGQVVEFDFGDSRIIDGPGRDFNVYADGQSIVSHPELERIDVLVSIDGVNFVSVKSTIGAMVTIPGDEMQAASSHTRSFNLAGSGLSEVRFVRIEGNGDEPSGSLSGYELDAIGAIHFSSPDACAITGDCDADGDVDLDDYANMYNCLLGPSGGMTGGCECSDFNNNGEIDLRDFAGMQVNFTGSQ
ncbi:MAG: hypothetical protein GXP29_03070 [Planctomycetes bacterium]|nr:hypothetical protein [Planctomycetota bacterium]